MPDSSGHGRSDGEAYVHHVRRTDGVGERGHAGDELGREMDTTGAAPASGYRFILRDPRLLLWAFRGHGVVFAVALFTSPWVGYPLVLCLCVVFSASALGSRPVALAWLVPASAAIALIFLASAAYLTAWSLYY